VFIDLPPQVNGLSQLDHWRGNRKGRIRTCDVKSYALSALPPELHSAPPLTAS
jgi:hypothetical protein